MSGPINVALASNLAGFAGLKVAAASIAAFASRNVALRFFILTDGTEDCSEALAETERCLVRLHPDVSVTSLPVRDADLADMPCYHGSRMTYARLLLPKMMPDSDFVVYCDIDFLWLHDVAELWAVRDEEVPLMAVHDGIEFTRKMECPWFEARGLKYDFERYFCAGLCLFNLKMFRTRRLDEALVAFARENPDANLVDQTALNALLCDEVRLLPERWQVFSRYAQADRFALPVVIHYAGDAPWNITRRSHLVSDVQLLWFAFDAAMRGISLWRSLRMRYSAAAVIAGRMAFVAVSSLWPLRWAFGKLLSALNRPPYQERMRRSDFRAAREMIRAVCSKLRCNVVD